MAWGCLAGIVALAFGMIGPLFLLPQANLGPLLAIVTAPAGAALGALAGAIRSVRRAPPGREGEGLRWLIVLELLALVWMLWGVDLAVVFALPALALQALILLVATMLRASGRARELWTPHSRKRVGVAIVAGTIILALSLVPPVRDVNTGRMGLAFVMDSRFDSRTRVPAIRVDRPLLAIEVIAVMAGALVMGRAIRRRDTTSAG